MFSTTLMLLLSKSPCCVVYFAYFRRCFCYKIFSTFVSSFVAKVFATRLTLAVDHWSGRS